MVAPSLIKRDKRPEYDKLFSHGDNDIGGSGPVRKMSLLQCYVLFHLILLKDVPRGRFGK